MRSSTLSVCRVKFFYDETFLISVFTSVAGGMGGSIDQDLSSSSIQQQQQNPMLSGLQLSQSTSSLLGTDETCCLQLTFHRAVRNRLLLLYPKELVILDVVSMQSVAQVVLDKSASPFVHAYPCTQRDAIYFFQVSNRKKVFIYE